jgi:hypothetical protein
MSSRFTHALAAERFATLPAKDAWPNAMYGVAKAA